MKSKTRPLHSAKIAEPKHSDTEVLATAVPDPIRSAANQYVLKPEVGHFLPELQSHIQHAMHSSKTPTTELKAARLLNLDSIDDPKLFIQQLESRISEITHCRKSVILLLDESTGIYHCLNDDARLDNGQPARELTWVSDNFLQELLGAEQVLYSYLCDDSQIFGIVAIAEKISKDGRLDVNDQFALEQMTPYLSMQIKHFMRLQKSLIIPSMQRVLLHISNKLLEAVDSTAIFKNALEAIMDSMPFTAGQFIQLDKKLGTGRVVYQLEHGHFASGKALRRIEHFSALLSLFNSEAWAYPYLHLKGEKLGDHAFSDIFGLPDIKAVLLLPVLDERKELSGALVLFQQEESKALSKQALDVLQQVTQLIESACERARVLEKALEIATTDELTETLNRRGFYAQCHAEVDRARRYKRPLSVALIDLDYFKQINDTHGHLVGDAILKFIGLSLKTSLRKSDIICRFGGEEFAIVFPETTVTRAAQLMNRIRKQVEKQIMSVESGDIRITFSAGVELVDVENKQSGFEVMSHALARADKALYDAKRQGRNQVVIA